MGVYLLHFEQSYHHARHYLGSAEDITKRVAAHQQGRGAHLTKAVYLAGIAMRLVRTWPGGRTEERALKIRHNGCDLCPLCNPTGRFAGKDDLVSEVEGKEVKEERRQSCEKNG